MLHSDERNFSVGGELEGQAKGSVCWSKITRLLLQRNILDSAGLMDLLLSLKTWSQS
jgi:hypothetical protein